MDLSKYEQETIINFNEAEKVASVYTHNKALKRKLAALAEQYPDECITMSTNHDAMGVDYVVPKRWIKVSPPRRVSEAQLMALSNARTKMTPKTTAHAEV